MRTLALLSALLLAPVAAWSSGLSAFGADGDLIEVVGGRYDELFARGADALPDSLVLALEITPSAGPAVRLLVPGSEGPEADHPLALISDGGQHFMLWSTASAQAGSLLQLVGYDGSEWTDLIEITGEPTLQKGPPRLSVTRDAYGESVLADPRTIAHVLWWENVDDEIAVRYTPVVFVGGRYFGWNPVVDLTAFDANPAVEQSAVSDGLFRAANLELGADVRSVVAAIPRKPSSRLLTLQMRVLPEPLLRMANDIRARIVGIGRATESRTSILRLADEIRARIVGVGRMHVGVREFIAEKTYAAILSYGASFVPEESEQIADLGWLSVIESGASILGNGLRESNLPCSILYLGSKPEQMVGSEHQIEICLTSDRPAPSTGSDREHTIFVSESGAEALVAWEDGEGSILYRESQGDDWAEPQSVTLGETLTREEALRILRHSVRLQ
jgi:hypothetical protein